MTTRLGRCPYSSWWQLQSVARSVHMQHAHVLGLSGCVDGARTGDERVGELGRVACQTRRRCRLTSNEGMEPHTKAWADGRAESVLYASRRGLCAATTHRMQVCVPTLLGACSAQSCAVRVNAHPARVSLFQPPPLQSQGRAVVHGSSPGTCTHPALCCIVSAIARHVLWLRVRDLGRRPTNGDREVEGPMTSMGPATQSSLLRGIIRSHRPRTRQDGSRRGCPCVSTGPLSTTCIFVSLAGSRHALIQHALRLRPRPGHLARPTIRLWSRSRTMRRHKAASPR